MSLCLPFLVVPGCKTPGIVTVGHLRLRHFFGVNSAFVRLFVVPGDLFSWSKPLFLDPITQPAPSQRLVNLEDLKDLWSLRKSCQINSLESLADLQLFLAFVLLFLFCFLGFLCLSVDWCVQRPIIGLAAHCLHH